MSFLVVFVLLLEEKMVATSLHHINYCLLFTDNIKYLGELHVWDVKNNVPIYKESNADSQSIKSTKSITNMIFNETRSILAICYVDNTVTLQSFGPQHSKLTVC